jgi:hypothetical protein
MHSGFCNGSPSHEPMHHGPPGHTDRRTRLACNRGADLYWSDPRPHKMTLRFTSWVIAVTAWSITTLLCHWALAEERWEWRRLAPIPNAFGVAGPIAGTDGESLIVAGGANFPDAPPWQCGKKAWHDRIYVRKDPENPWIDAGRLSRPIGYAVSLSIPIGRMECRGTVFSE